MFFFFWGGGGGGREGPSQGFLAGVCWIDSGVPGSVVSFRGVFGMVYGNFGLWGSRAFDV